MSNRFAIAFPDRNKRVYQPCETISGVVLLNTDEELTLRGVRVELHGLGYVRIRDYLMKVTYIRKETYLGKQAILLGRGPFQRGNNIKLPPGNYSLPFQFHLPPCGLPSSFAGRYGGVRYWVHAEADRPWKFNFKFDAPFVIVERVQIRHPALLQPNVKHKVRNLGLVCCPAGQLYAKARIDRSAYCPGEKIKITGHVSNQSSKRVIGTEVQLLKKIVFKAPHDTSRTDREHLYVVKNERGFAPGEEGDVQFDPITVPSVQPTTEGFNCVDISYSIRFIVRVASAFNTEIDFPVVITSVPPSAQPSHELVLSQQLYGALANFLMSRASAELAEEAGEEDI